MPTTQDIANPVESKTELKKSATELPDISIPGVRKLYGPKYNPVCKVMWLSALVICFALCILQIRERIDFFTNTSIAVDVKITPNQPFRLPYVTICPRGQGATNKAIRKLLLEYNATLANTSGPFVHLKNEMSDILHLPGMTVDEAWNLTKIPISTINVQVVDDKDALESFDYAYYPAVTGMCITIRIREKTQVLPPVAHLTIARGTSLVPKGLYGYAIAVHEDPRLLSYDYALRGMVIQTQYTTTLTLKANKFIRINTRNSPCLSSYEELFQCRKRCLDKTLATKINCSLPVHNIPTLKPCSSPWPCYNSIMTTLKSFMVFEWAACGCPPKCLEMVYDVKWRAQPLREPMTGVRIRFHSSALETTEEAVAYNGVSLFCDIGSILSLLLGVCLLTFLQLIEMVVYSVQACIHRKRGKAYFTKKPQAISTFVPRFQADFYHVRPNHPLERYPRFSTQHPLRYSRYIGKTT